jgi:integrase
METIMEKTKRRTKGDGFIMKRGKSWRICVSYRVDGKPKQKWETVKGSEPEAKRRLREMLRELDKGIIPASGKLRVGEYLDTWLRDTVALRNRPRTAEGYATIVRKHISPTLGHIQLVKLQPADVQKLEASLSAAGLSDNTVHHVHICLSKAIKDAQRTGLVDRNVCQLVVAPSPGRYEVDVPDAQAIARILALADASPYGAMLRFMAFTGVRRGEAVAFRWANIDLDRSMASITETAQRHKGMGIVVQPPKSAAGRRGIALDAGTVDMLRAHRGRQVLNQVELLGAFQDNGLVFPGPLGGVLDSSVVTRNFKKLARQVGYAGMRLHDLRHGHAAGLMKLGIYPKTIQERLGHASAAFTLQVYGHVAADAQAEAANAFAELMAKPADLA